MSQFLTSILNSGLFIQIAAAVWLLICIADKEARNALRVRLSTLVAKPLIFEKDPEPESYPFYARNLIERTAVVFREAFTLPLHSVISQFQEWIKIQTSLVYNPKSPKRIVGYFLYLVFFLLFVWADAIAIANSMASLNILSVKQLPQYLTYFEVAVFMGSLGSVIVAGQILMEIQSERSVLSNWDEQSLLWKGIARIIAGFLIVLAILVVISLGLQRLALLVNLAPEVVTSVTAMGNFALVVFVPVNNILGAMLLFYEALLGIFVVMVVLQIPLLWVMYVVNILTTALGVMLPYIFDVVYRVTLIIFDLFFYILLTPIDLITGTPLRIFSRTNKS
jgi:hypothetical protein